VPTSPDLTDLLADAVAAATGHTAERLPSGAGHDSVSMATVADIAMLFVRCERGISHNPAEAVAEADVAVALDVLERFLGELR
jgi:allantoate deiminase